MDYLVKKKVGMIGYSSENGHPYSFSSIINGVNLSKLKNTEWQGIYNYIKEKDYTELVFSHIKITHIWTQDMAVSQEIAAVASIENIVQHYEDMVNEVDAIIIARDDYKKHFLYAQPFLENGLKVLIDKPLTLNREEYHYFKPYIESGQLMSLSGMRYATELDSIKNQVKELGKLKHIHTIGISDWERYIIHLLDATFPLLNSKIAFVQCLSPINNLFHIHLEDGTEWIHYNEKDIEPTFEINLYAENQNVKAKIKDNFTMFKRMLKRFERLVAFNEIPDDQLLTLDTIRLLILMKEAKESQKIMYWEDFQ